MAEERKMDSLGNLYLGANINGEYRKLAVIHLDEFGNCKEEWTKIDKKTYDSVIDLEDIIENERFELEDKWTQKN